MSDILKHKKWTAWNSFPDPKKQEYLFAPFGFGVHQLFNNKTNEYILFGRGKNLAYRITTLFPRPVGQGTRNNNKKKNYVLKHLKYIQYRTIPLHNEQECRDFERRLKELNNHIFNENRE